jgi:outer membrane receptor for ferrienterochelin and colicin
MPITFRPAQATGLFLACCATVHATEPLKSEPAETKPAAPPVAKVEVKGKGDDYDPRRDDTASKTVMTREEILKYGDTNVFDVLKRAPGVTVIGNSIRMRGLGNGYTQVLVNGERPPPGFSMDTLAPDQIERIEVIRAATAEFSMQAIAGTINIVLRKVVSKPQRDLRISVNHAEEKQSRLVNGTLADRSGNLSYYLNANLARNLKGSANTATDQFTTPDGVVTQLRDSRVTWQNNNWVIGLQPRLNWKLSEADQLNLSAYYTGQRGESGNVGSIVNRIGASPAPDYVDAYSSQDSSGQFRGGELNWVSKLWGGKLDAKLSGSYGYFDSGSQQVSATAGGAIQLRRLRDGRMRFKSVGSSGKYNRGMFAGHALAAGWELARQQTDDDNHRIEGFVGTPPNDIRERFTPEVRRMAAFVQDEWSVSAQWSMYVGARWEGIRTESSGSGLAPAVSDSRVLTPVAQTLYKFPDKSGRQLRLAFTRTFKAPEINQLTARRYDADQNTRFSPDHSGNPALRPELANGLDLTYEHFWAPGAVFSASTSVRRIRDYIRSTLAQDANGLWLIQPVNDGSAEVRTLDLELKFPLKAVMQGKDALPLDLRASLNRNWSKVESVPGPDNRLDQQIPLSAVFGADYKTEKISMGINYAVRTGGMVRISQEQSSRQALRRDLDGYFQYTVRKGLDLRLSVGNALGMDTVNYSRYQDAGGTSETWSRNPSSLELRLNIGIKY